MDELRRHRHAYGASLQMSNDPTHPQKKNMLRGLTLGLISIPTARLPRALITEKKTVIYRCTFSPKHRPEPSDSSHNLPLIATQASHLIHRSHVWQESTGGATLSGGERSAPPSLAKSSAVIFLRFPRSAAKKIPPTPAGFHGSTEQDSPLCRLLSSLSN